MYFTMYFMYWFLLLFCIFSDAQAMLETGEQSESKVSNALIVIDKTKNPTFAQIPEIPEKDLTKVCFKLLQILENTQNENDKIFAQQMRSYMRLMIGAFEKNISLEKLNLNVIMYSYATLQNNEIRKMVISRFQDFLRRRYVDCGMLDVHGFTVPLQSDQNLIEVYFDILKAPAKRLQT